MKNILEVKHLSIDYLVKEGDLSAVSNVSFQIGEKEIFALIGESGCGKSTIGLSIMNLLLSNNQRISGEILFGNQNIFDLNKNEMAGIRGKEIGMIFQNPLDSLNPVYTSGWQIAEAVRIDRIEKKEAWAKAYQMFKDVKIPDAQERMKSFPHELSGGMRQRVMIGMMLSRKPKLLIADEPTTALDVTIQAQILDILMEMKDQYHTSVLMITHNFGIVAQVADRVGVMYAGKMVEQGDVYSIFEDPKHPYTQMLMKSLPVKQKGAERLSTIPGTVPKLIGDIKGCRFENRCPHAMDICRNIEPKEINVGEDHFCSCHLIGPDQNV